MYILSHFFLCPSYCHYYSVSSPPFHQLLVRGTAVIHKIPHKEISFCKLTDIPTIFLTSYWFFCAFLFTSDIETSYFCRYCNQEKMQQACFAPNFLFQTLIFIFLQVFQLLFIITFSKQSNLSWTHKSLEALEILKEHYWLLWGPTYKSEFSITF